MTRDELTVWINNEITGGGSISVEMPKAEIKRVIEKSVLEVYQLYQDSLEHKWMLMPRDLFWTKAFRETRTIQFADCVTSVIKFQEARRRYSFYGFNDPDLSFDKAVNSGIYFGSQFNNEWITGMQISWLTWDQMKLFSLIDIQHSWNPITHRLLVTGHDPKADVVCEMYVRVPEDQLFDDPWVRKYICGKCKIEMSRIIGTFQATLVGSVQINYGVWKEEGAEDVNECKDYWKEMQQGSWFISFP